MPVIQTITRRGLRLTLCLMALLIFAVPALAGEDSEIPTVSEQVLGLEAMCAENADAIAARQAEKSLFERLGGEKGIREFVTEIVAQHDKNPDFERFMGDVDQAALIDGVTDFVVAGTGGGGSYEGRDMPDAHKHLKLTNADFLSAGSDVMKAGKKLGVGENEVQEFICVLVSLRAATVVDEDKVVQ